MAIGTFDEWAIASSSDNRQIPKRLAFWSDALIWCLRGGLLSHFYGREGASLAVLPAGLVGWEVGVILLH